MRRNSAFIALVAVTAQGCAGIPSPVTSLHQTSALDRRPRCDAVGQVAKFEATMGKPKPALKPFDRAAGAASTPLKYLSSEFGGPGAWTDTGCNASGLGVVFGHPTQHSTDDLYTIDVCLLRAEVNGVRVDPGTFVRLEVRPGWPAHNSARLRPPRQGEVIEFSGPLIWDGDKRPAEGFPNGHIEIHPIEPFEYLETTPVIGKCAERY